jgi:hypothetical protein
MWLLLEEDEVRYSRAYDNHYLDGPEGWQQFKRRLSETKQAADLVSDSYLSP